MNLNQALDTKWTSYYLNQEKQEFDEPFEYFVASKGVCMVEGIKIRINDDFGSRTVKSGTYELRCTDVTRGLLPRMQMKQTRILLKLCDIDEEAAIQAAAVAAAAASKNAGKKK